MTSMQTPFPKVAPREQGQYCPVCDQPIPNERAGLVRSRLEDRERDLASSLRMRLQDEFSAEKARIESAAREAVDAIRKESALALEKAAREAAERELAAREHAAAAAREEVGNALAAAERERADALLRLETLGAEQDQIVAARLEEERAAMEKATEDLVTGIKVKHFEEKQRLTIRLEELARQLENKSAEERGEGAEVDLFEALKSEFPHDVISRVAKGSAGPDVIHEVVHRDRICGRIVYDCKNRSTWRGDYVTKLRNDQMALGAEHAILSSTVFPSGLRQFGELGGILVANPARVLSLVHLLRRHLVRMDTLRLGNEERSRKMTELYGFMRSEKCLQMFERVDLSAQGLIELQERERRDHEARWKRQETLLRNIRQAGNDLRSEIDAIVEAAARGDSTQPAGPAAPSSDKAATE